jgi:LysM repeat protein
MRGLRSLSGGLFLGLGIAATVFGALILSVRGPLAASISELPIPTVTLQTVFVSPAPAHTPVPRASAHPLSPQPSAVSSQTSTPAPTMCLIPANWQRYSVGPFDTVTSIAQRFNLAADQLVRANCLGQPGVTVGQTIYVPGFGLTPTASAPCFPPYNWSRYVVRPGDTLSSIAMRYGISVYTLMRANCLSTTFIYYGQALYVPPTGPIVIYTPAPIFPTITPPSVTAEPPPSITAEPLPSITAEPPTITAEPPPSITAEPPTITAEPPASITPEPPPSITAEPPPSITAEPPPAATTEPPPANTPIPPANTPIPPPANTPIPPPANTPEPPPVVTTLP